MAGEVVRGTVIVECHIPIKANELMLIIEGMLKKNSGSVFRGGMLNLSTFEKKGKTSYTATP